MNWHENINNDPYAQYREQPTGCRDTIITLLVGLSILVFVLSVSGCGSVKSSTITNTRDSVVYNYKDSTIYNYRDSVRVIEQHIVIRDSSGLVIQFGNGGGTYNAKTGEATNVAGVHQTNTHNEQKDSTAHYRNQYEQAISKTDSLQQQISDYSQQIDKERKGNAFYAKWFWATFIFLLLKVAAWVCEKIPVTAPYVAVVRKFVPFL